MRNEGRRMRKAECGQTAPPEIVRCRHRPKAPDILPHGSRSVVRRLAEAGAEGTSCRSDLENDGLPPRTLRGRNWLERRSNPHTRQVTRPIGSQLYRALGSIPSNIAEGYSRSSGLDRPRHFEYGLGSVRESTCWYFGARPVLGQDVLQRRDPTLSQIRRLLLASIPVERQRPRLRKT